MTTEACTRSDGRGGKRGERNEDKHVRDAQSTVIRKKRTKRREKTERNQGHIIEKPRKERKGSIRRKGCSSPFKQYSQDLVTVLS